MNSLCAALLLVELCMVDHMHRYFLTALSVHALQLLVALIDLSEAQQVVACSPSGSGVCKPTQRDCIHDRDAEVRKSILVDFSCS